MRRLIILFALFWAAAFAQPVFDNATGGNGTSTSVTLSHTVNSNTNGILLLFCTTSATVSAATDNGVAMTAIDANGAAGCGWNFYDFYLLAPSTGTNNIVVTNTGAVTLCNAISYTGAKQSDQPDNHAFTISLNTGGNPLTQALTTVADNSLVVGQAFFDNTASIAAGSNTTQRSTASNAARRSEGLEANAAIHPAGSTTIAATNDGSVSCGNIAAVSIAPVAAAGPPANQFPVVR